MWVMSGFADEISPDLETQCAVLAELGIRFIELRSAWDVNVLDLSDEQVAQVERVLAEHGIGVSAIGSPIGKINIADDFEAHLVRMDRAVWVAQRLGAPYIRVFSFFLTPEQRPQDVRDEVIRRMTALAERAAAGGVVLLHENEKEIFGDIPERVHDIVTTVGSPALRLAWDAANYVQCGVVPFPEAYALLRPFTDYIQIKDAVLATGEVVPAGQGDGRLPETIAALVADGYDGFCSMEPHLASAHHLGGFSGPDNFIRATKAFTGLLRAQGIEYR
ncbi:MAG TPA: sugar phosphate isomerase/epimerase family protein [Actinotalea sp.]|nr:sugar phosphate isomerase/epimerase family protein [Actinotalea sp.]